MTFEVVETKPLKKYIKIEIAGTEESGPDAGFAELFDNRWCILTPTEDNTSNAIHLVKKFWESLGSKVEIMEPSHHDKVLAITSHIPHLIAFNIVGTANNLATVTEKEVVKYSAGGFRDFTRIAASDPKMWSDIFTYNSDAVLEMLEAIKDGVEWIAAPKPILTDASYQFDNIKDTPSLTNIEPIFDAPNCIRLGKDILFQISNTGNQLGMQWLKNTLEPRGYRVHAAEHVYSYAHMDSTIIPLRAGKVLLNSTRVNSDNCPKIFDSWDKIYFENVNINPATDTGPGSVSPCSPYIGMNILSIDPDTVVVGKDQTNLIRVLEKDGMNVVPVTMRHAQTLSGGLHCTTLDLRRRGGLEDYT